MFSQSNYLEWIFGFGLMVIGVLLPVVLMILLAVWLINKQRRDDVIIQRLVQIHRTLEDLRERVGQAFGRRQ